MHFLQCIFTILKTIIGTEKKVTHFKHHWDLHLNTSFISLIGKINFEMESWSLSIFCFYFVSLFIILQFEVIWTKLKWQEWEKSLISVNIQQLSVPDHIKLSRNWSHYKINTSDSEKDVVGVSQQLLEGDVPKCDMRLLKAHKWQSLSTHFRCSNRYLMLSESEQIYSYWKPKSTGWLMIKLT